MTAVGWVTPSLRRLVITGSFDGYRPSGGDESLRLVLPRSHHRSDRDLPGPCTLPTGPFTVDPATVRSGRRVRTARCTVRAHRGGTGGAPFELELWVAIRHSGALSSWAVAATPGDRLAVRAPRRAYAPPTDTTCHLLVCDETGVAAVAAILDGLGPGQPASVVVETGGPLDRVPLPSGIAVTVTWVHRGAAPPGCGTGLLDAVRALDIAPTGPAGHGAWYVFGAGEAGVMATVGRHLRHHVGLSPERITLRGHWSRNPRYEPTTWPSADVSARVRAT